MSVQTPSTDYTIAALWMDGALSFLEQLCLKSFVDAGHPVKLYHYGPLQNVPDGIELVDAEDILPREGFLTHQRTGSPALHSDLFRYKMLAQSEQTIWADTDAYCMKKFETPNGHFYGWESDRHINGGVLGLPADSDTLSELLEYTKDEFAIPLWYGEDYVRELEVARDAGRPVHASEQPWGVWGPHAVTYFLHKTGESKYALPQEGLYPFTFKDRRMMLKRNFDTSPYITDNTYSVHLYGRRMRARLVEKEGGAPHHKSLLGRLLTKHGIDPQKAPLPMPRAQQGTQPLTTNERVGRGQKNLTDLADKHGTDKGTNKHRFSELYQMLLLPYRDRKINLLEMGLQVGGPEHGFERARKTDDLPSIRMWLEFFTKAHVYGLDVSDFSWFDDPRFTFVNCDMDRRENLETAAKELPSLDVIIDDAAHASHHQQNAFLELFPKLKSGGLYAIEGLRWQPQSMEQSGISKTADIFQSYQKSGVFTHSDPVIAEQFNALRKDISGCFVFQAGFDKKKRDQIVVIHKR